MNSELPVSNKQITSFVDLLKNNLPEHRDNRGKRHTLVWVIVSFVLAMLIGRQKLSSVHRSRETVDIAKQKTTFDTSYYVSNSAIESSSIQVLTEELARAIRCHWRVKSNNWIRDVTFNEDHIKTKAGNQAQIMALLRGLAIKLIRKTSPKNFQVAIENLSDSIANLESILRQVKF